MVRHLYTVFILTLFTTFSLSAFALPVAGLLGRWRAIDYVQGQNVEFDLRFNFQQDMTEMSVTCLYPDGASLETHAQASTNYSANEIYIQQTNNSVIDDGFHFCRATLQPTKWTAYFDGTGQMVLFVDVPFQSRLTLARDEI